MDWVKLTQKSLRSIHAQEFVDALAKGLPENGKLGQIFMMPKTFHGSRQYYQKCYADLMTMIQHTSDPTWYISHFTWRL